MAKQPEIQYIGQFYVHGSEAQKVAWKPERKKSKTQLPKVVRQEKTKVYVDPVALCGLVVAVAMVILMSVCVCSFATAFQEYESMEQHVIDLRDTNASLQHTFRSGYDLEEIEEKALALGMIPVEEAQTIIIDVTVPEPEPEPTAWDDFLWFINGLFA